MQVGTSFGPRSKSDRLGEGSWNDEGETVELRDGAAAPKASKRFYSPPVLEIFGDIRDVTLGPSPGVGESGAPVMFKP